VSILGQALGAISGGRVLDVATGEGAFIRSLVAHLRCYRDIVGIDIVPPTPAAGSPFHAKNVHFLQMDAAHLAFADERYDTLALSSSLHHLQDIPRSIAEIKRVLKPGGQLIIRETHRDVGSAAQRTDRDLHHWVAEIDTALGEPHHRTFTRQELLDLAGGLGLYHLAVYDIPNRDANPMEETAIRETEAILARYLHYARTLPRHGALEQRGQELRRRLHQVGIQWEPELIIIGQKP
jgi:SAM-dependent methyltransferase